MTSPPFQLFKFRFESFGIGVEFVGGLFERRDALLELFDLRQIGLQVLVLVIDVSHCCAQILGEVRHVGVFCDCESI